MENIYTLPNIPLAMPVWQFLLPYNAMLIKETCLRVIKLIPNYLTKKKLTPNHESYIKKQSMRKKYKI